MIRRLFEALGWSGPARWTDDPDLDACVGRHPAGKQLRPGP